MENTPAPTAADLGFSREELEEWHSQPKTIHLSFGFKGSPSYRNEQKIQCDVRMIKFALPNLRGRIRIDGRLESDINHALKYKSHNSKLSGEVEVQISKIKDISVKVVIGTPGKQQIIDCPVRQPESYLKCGRYMLVTKEEGGQIVAEIVIGFSKLWRNY